MVMKISVLTQQTGPRKSQRAKSFSGARKQNFTAQTKMLLASSGGK